MSPLLRPATDEDVSLLLAIENASFRQPHWTARDFLKFRCEVAEIEGEIAGFLVVREIYSGDGSTSAELEILNVAVAPKFRRRGIASLLISNELQSGMVYFLEVRESNVAAQTLYRQLGFEEMGRRPKYYSNPQETAIVMRTK